MIKKGLSLVLLLAGLGIAIYLALHPQVFKSKAAINLNTSISGEGVEPTTEAEPGVPTFKVQNKSFKIHFTPPTTP